MQNIFFKVLYKKIGMFTDETFQNLLHLMLCFFIFMHTYSMWLSELGGRAMFPGFDGDLVPSRCIAQGVGPFQCIKIHVTLWSWKQGKTSDYG